MPIHRTLAEVFSTVGLPAYTYVKPSIYGEVKADILHPGKHLLVEGPSGVGKTCIIYKVLEELGWKVGVDYVYYSCRRPEDVRAAHDALVVAEEADVPPHRLVIVDDFHLLDAELRSEFGFRLKTISDRAFQKKEVAKFAMLGIPASGISLLTNAHDLGPRIGPYKMKTASDKEIAPLVDEGERQLNVIFEDRTILLSEIAGNFWLAQYICQKVCASQDVHHTQDETTILHFDLLSIRRRLMDELSDRYLMPVSAPFCKGKKWRPGGNKPYLEIFIALAKVRESVVTFDKMLASVPEVRRTGVKAVRARIPDVILNAEKGIDLRKHLHFSDASCFSIEDPLFRYFLNHIEMNDLYRALGVEPPDENRDYEYDVGFSFAGEVRRLVERANQLLKEEDVVTFYDFDAQAVLLAEDLESLLPKVYGASCRYYLVFMDENYKRKVWTKYEKDIMTHSGRTGHIIPVVLDAEGMTGLVGIPSTIGHIDLKESWAATLRKGTVDDDAVGMIKNRLVVPILAKIDGI